MRAIALRKIISIRRAPSNGINVISAILVKVDEPDSQTFGDVDGSSAFVGEVLYHGAAAEDSAGQRSYEDRSREGGGNFFGEGAQVVGVVRDGDPGGLLLVVVAELDRHEDVVGRCVGFDFGEDDPPVSAGAEGDCCCAAVA